MADTTGSGSSIGTAATAAAAAAAVVGGFAAYQAFERTSGGGVTEYDAARFLNQVTFGARRQEIDAMLELGISADSWIDQQRDDGLFNTSANALAVQIDQALREKALAQAKIDFDAGKYTVATYATQVRDINNYNYIGGAQFQRIVLWLMVDGDDQLRQRVAFALSQIFVVSFKGIPDGWATQMVAHYYDILRANAFANFKDLLRDVTLSCAMGRYLNMAGNYDRKNGIKADENYAREVLQLMSIGLDQLNIDSTVKTDANGQPIPAYSQVDISNLAKIFTGWNQPGGRGPRSMVALPQFHSLDEKTVLGKTFPALTISKPTTAQLQDYQNQELEAALDLIFNHPNVGPFIALRLIQRLIKSNPSPGYVARVASTFNNNGLGVRGDLFATVKAILTDGEARPPGMDPYSGKLREPLLRYTQLLRSLNAEGSPPSVDKPGSTDVSGALYTPFTANTVFNFWSPFYSPPNSELASNGMRAPELQEVYTSSSVTYASNMVACVSRGGITPQLEHRIDFGAIADVFTDPSVGKLDVDATIIHFDLLLCGGYMGDPLKAQIRSTLAGIIPKSNTPSMDVLREVRVVQLKAALGLVMLSIDYLIQV